ncbi:MAG: hypothetical protein HYZ13_09235 [Acidobacteria bacterium]|nr:hypothetical protein [Acidobacteriota bacterium]
MLLWRGSKALGLHPWSPEALRLLPFQLEWAAIQAREDRGEGLRRRALDQEAADHRRKVADLAVWADRHVSRWRRP